MTDKLPPIAVFDLDGTLADTAPDLVAALNHVLTGENLPPLSFERARDMIGSGARALIRRGFDEAGNPPVEDADMERMFRVFIDYYERNLLNETRLFPGVPEALDRFRNAGWVLAVCTNKFENQSLQLLDLLGIADRFTAICGRDTFPYYKPDPRHLTLTIDRAGGSPVRAVMIGDSGTDISTARAAGLPVVAVPFGYSDVPVAELGPDRLVAHFDDLWTAVTEIAGSHGSDRKTTI
ncbi:phosphoglycolate phosphatase [Pseudochelatococcus contaminans]|uniref:Phosphoglycolate phosphatase n=1 Tax=Pseudochelatococcus contaminans TaxID=1538103 RepID=A0A7W5Z0T4_9HYPH|nr:phosphoglycolate phosphatase [Pseudochelatococcus contaminans]MBB3807955.1 phosphoglycolate phosphatase [Pseudochelatococcus contaminans]